MDPLTVFVLLIVSILGFVGGYFFGKSKAYQSNDLSTQSSMISQLTTQLSEVKTKFLELEKRREEVEKERAKNSEEREKRWKEFITNQSGTMDKVTNSMGQFQRLLFGTKQRGQAGEEVLKNILKEAIVSGMIKTNVNTGNGPVEFALDLNDGKYIPIDSKLPDVFELRQKLEKTENSHEQNSIKKEIKRKVEKCVKEVTKYLHQDKTIDKCILTVPDDLIEMFPEIVDYARKKNVYLTSYSFTYLLAYLLYEEYQRYKAEGDLGEYKKNVEILLKIIDGIQKKTETIERGIKMVQNASAEISDTARKAKKI